MQTSPTITEITKAIVAVMKSVKGIEKSMTVGTGNSAYKGVSDKDVKAEISREMEKVGLCIVPTEVEPSLRIDRWEEVDQYAKVQGAMKQKQQVFTEVKTKYLLMHESGEWIELSGYGHGVDTQDKAAGKATTYALKYTLLYTFLVPTGKIDDADTTPSNEYQAPPAQPAKQKLSDDALNKALARIQNGEKALVQKLKDTYALTQEQSLKLDGYTVAPATAQ